MAGLDALTREHARTMSKRGTATTCSFSCREGDNNGSRRIEEQAERALGAARRPVCHGHLWRVRRLDEAEAHSGAPQPGACRVAPRGVRGCRTVAARLDPRGLSPKAR